MSLQSSRFTVQESFNSNVRSSVLSAFRTSLKLGVCCLMLSGDGMRGQNPAPTASSLSSRYLLVINTSRAMEARAAGVQNAIADLLASNLGKQLRRGDTLGIWTFNEDLYTGRFPLQKWSPEAKDEIVLHVASFLKNQKYEKKANLDKVLPTLQKIIQTSEFITVVLVSDGDEKMRGTPFDAQINKYYSLWREQQRKAQMPLLTLLRGRNGEITHFAMNTAPWPLEMPPLAPEIKALVEAEKNASKNVRTSSVAPLIISGKKLREEREKELAENSAARGAPLTNRPPDTAATPIPLAGGTNPPVQEEPLATSATASATRPEAAQPDLAQETKKEPSVAEAKGDPSVVPKEANDIQATSSASPAISSTNSLPAAVAAIPPASRLNVKLLFFGGVILIGAVWIGAVLVLRRSRETPRVSLITRSLEREKKQ